MAGEKKRKAGLRPAAPDAEDSYDDDEDEESEEEVEACTACGGRTRQVRVNCRPGGAAAPEARQEDGKPP